jgi:hypothetical protein
MSGNGNANYCAVWVSRVGVREVTVEGQFGDLAKERR